MYTFFLARKVYTLSKELYSTVKKDVLSMGWGGGLCRKIVLRLPSMNVSHTQKHKPKPC